MPPPDPPEPRVIPPAPRAEKMQLYMVYVNAFVVWINMLAGVSSVIEGHNVLISNIVQAGVWSIVTVMNYSVWKKTRDRRIAGVLK